MAEIGKIGGFTSLLDDSFIFERLTIMDYPKFVTKTIQLLGANSGLRLVFAQDIAESHFDAKAKVVSIPAPPPFPAKKKREKEDELKKRKEEFYDQLAEWRGVLNHEVGHAQFTLWDPNRGKKPDEFNLKKKLYPAKNHTFIDLFENGRMERVACDKYPGMMRDLQRLESSLQRIIKEVRKKHGKRFFHLYYALRMAVNGYDPVFPLPLKFKKDWEVCLGFAKEAWGTKNEYTTLLIAIKAQEYIDNRMEELRKEEEERKKERERKKKELEEKEREIKEKREELRKEKEKEEEEKEEKEEKDDDDEEENEEEDEEDEEDDEDKDEDGEEEENELGEHDDKKDEDGDIEVDGDGDEDGDMEIEMDDGDGKEEAGINEDNADINSEEGEDGDGELEVDADGDPIENVAGEGETEETKGETDGESKDGEVEDGEVDETEEGEDEEEADERAEKISAEEEQGDEKNLEKEREDGEEEEESGSERIEKELAELEEEEKALKEDLGGIEEEEKESLDTDQIHPEKAEIIDPIAAFEVIAALFEKIGRYESDSYRDVIPMPLDDYVKNIEIMPKKSSKKTQKVLDKIMGTVSGMAQRFIQRVRSSRHVATRTYKGRISNRNLHKYRTSKNIFKTENIRMKKGASVMIIVDCSGSMGGGKIETARKAALVMGEIMYQAKVEFEVVGFTVPFEQEFNFHAFTRRSRLVHYRFGGNVDWDQRKHGVLEGERDPYLQDNDDGESLRQFASQIAKSKKEQKLMVVISDGEPCSRAQSGNDTKDLHTAIADIRKEKIDIYAIGLDTNVSKFYGDKNSVNISARCSTEELVNALAQFIGLIGN